MAPPAAIAGGSRSGKLMRCSRRVFAKHHGKESQHPMRFRRNKSLPQEEGKK